jgi:hypothetical protein
LGAEVVGNPSSQAGNCFIDTLSFELQHSGIDGGLSYKRSLMFPDDPELGWVMPPDRVLTLELFKAYDFDPNAALLLALDIPPR